MKGLRGTGALGICTLGAMHRVLQVPLVLAVFATVVAGQAADTSSIILAPRSPEPSAVRTMGQGPADHAVSPALSSDISSGMPTFSPPRATSGTPTGDLRSLDRPRNQIPRLPIQLMQKYVVREDRIPGFRRLNLYTKAALIDQAFKEHPGLRFGNFFNLNANAAYNRLVDEELFADRLELVDTSLAMAAEGDKSEIKAMQQAIIDDGFSKESPVGK